MYRPYMGDEALTVELALSGDPDAQKNIADRLLHVARQQALKISHFGDIDDRIQVGALAAWSALPKFDPVRGTLSSFMTFYLRHAIARTPPDGMLSVPHSSWANGNIKEVAVVGRFPSYLDGERFDPQCTKSPVEEQALARIEVEDMFQLVRNMTSRQATAILLRAADKAPAQIVETLGAGSKATMDLLVQRARKKIRETGHLGGERWRRISTFATAHGCPNFTGGP